MCVLYAGKDPMREVYAYLEQMPMRTNTTLTAHRVYNKWKLSRKAKERMALYEAILFAGNMRFGVHNCVGARLAKGRQRLQGLDFAEVSEAPIYYYSPPRRDEYFTIHLDDPRFEYRAQRVCRGPQC